MNLNTYLRQRFGKKLYKLSINAGLTCPNRDGTCGDKGCIFCSGTGSGDFAPDPSLSVTKQLDLAKEKIAAKLPKGDSGFIAYFQAFTNTYAPVGVLKGLYTEAASYPGVEVVSIATRPDCLGEDVLDLISGIDRIKPVWIELGLQTIHEKSAEYIRRGYPLSVYDKAVADLGKRGIETIVHVILGLPGESRADMLETVRYVADSGVQGIKLQMLHVLKGTDLADDYLAGKFEVMTLEDYADLIDDCLAILPDDMIVHRITGDGAKKLLIAPLWSADKKRVLNYLNRHREPFISMTDV